MTPIELALRECRRACRAVASPTTRRRRKRRRGQPWLFATAMNTWQIPTHPRVVHLFPPKARWTRAVRKYWKLRRKENP